MTKGKFQRRKGFADNLPCKAFFISSKINTFAIIEYENFF